jgi:hypothetical protein
MFISSNWFRPATGAKKFRLVSHGRRSLCSWRRSAAISQRIGIRRPNENSKTPGDDISVEVLPPVGGRGSYRSRSYGLASPCREVTIAVGCGHLSRNSFTKLVILRANSRGCRRARQQPSNLILNTQNCMTILVWVLMYFIRLADGSVSLGAHLDLATPDRSPKHSLGVPGAHARPWF